MAGINKNIMAFVGTEDTANLVSALAEHTDNIYAAVSNEYGKAPHPGGNITVISKYLDEEKASNWIERVGVDIVIDGTDLSASGPREMIKKVCEQKGIEYLRIAAKQQRNMHTTFIRNEDQLLRELEYTVGNILAECDSKLYDLLTGVRNFREKTFIMIPAESGIFEKVIELGYKKENIISVNRIIHSDLLIAMFKEFGISDYVFPGNFKEGMNERLEAVDRSSVKAAVYGDFVQDEGMSVDEMWDMLAARFGIED